MMQNFLLVLLLTAVAPAAMGRMDTARSEQLGRYELLAEYSPFAHPGCTVTVTGPAPQGSSVRFSILTDRLLRIELNSPRVPFEDRATVAIVNRRLACPASLFNHSISDQGVLTISTTALSLSYTIGTLLEDTLHITSNTVLPALSYFEPYTYGDSNDGNLMGTIRSLDGLSDPTLNCTLQRGKLQDKEQLHCAWGVISTQGWAVLDDADNYALTDDLAWWADVPSFQPQNRDRVDVYFFGHGLRYRDAIRDFVKVAGRVPMVPRYATGVFWSRWYDFTGAGVRDVIDNYRSRAIPLDVFVFDMNWHKKDSDQTTGWTGYSWDARLFPYPDATLDFLHEQGLAVTCNIHDAQGVRSFETRYKAMAQAIHWPGAQVGETIPFSVVNRTIFYALDDQVLAFQEARGVDFWWIDWQQGGKLGGAAGGAQNPTVWTNKVRSTDRLRRQDPERDMVLARFGGLGSHRYPVGFSGDVNGVTWQSLAYQPYFTLTASNVAYGWWSHDVVGPANDPLLFTRWIQWATWSGVFRTHDRGMSAGGCIQNDGSGCDHVRIWDAPVPYFEASRAALRYRAMLVPLIYNYWRMAYDTGESLVRPLYWYWPRSPEAYLTGPDGIRSSFMFGDDILVAPVVTSPSQKFGQVLGGLTNRNIWLPGGGEEWIERDTGRFFAGKQPNDGMILLRTYPLDEVPVFVRSGTILPTRPLPLLSQREAANVIGRAAEPYHEIEYMVWPVSSVPDSKMAKLYEDDGHTTSYVGGACAWTQIRVDRNHGGTAATQLVTITVAAIVGNYSGMLQYRSSSVRLVNAFPPLKVTWSSVGGGSFGGVISHREQQHSANGGQGWWYDGPQTSLVIHGPKDWPTNRELVIQVLLPTQTERGATLSGVRGVMAHARLAKSALDEARQTPGAHSDDAGALMRLAALGDELSVLSSPRNEKLLQSTVKDNLFSRAIDSLPQLWKDAQGEVDSLKTGSWLSAERLSYAQNVLVASDLPL